MKQYIDNNVENEIVGKTIASIDAHCVNVWTVHFTDGTKLELEADDAVHTQYGNIPGILASIPKD
jgi:hypothetical protein